MLSSLLHLAHHCLRAYPGEHGLHVIAVTRVLHVVVQHGAEGVQSVQLPAWEQLTSAFSSRAGEISALRPDILLLLSKNLAGLSLAASGGDKGKAG